MRILAIGDVVGKSGTEFLRVKLNEIKKEKDIDFVIANGENSAEGNGITPLSANHMLKSGVDVITSGNHVFRRREIFSFLNENNMVIRPYNFPNKTTPGVGIYKTEVKGVKIAIINILGVVYLEPLNSPFEAIDNALEVCSDCKIKIIDFHAEATAEKRAMGYYVDGKVSAVFGTHTHVQTSDEQVLPFGTGYITDVGMTGVIHSVLGVKKEISIKRMKEKLPIRFQNAEGNCKIECIIFDIDESNGKTLKVERMRVI
ncbi:MAG: TIGR00282 family metallophosphoesterase [Clostridia bacterium]|nr:TIGR00282 family metallophosphoesterase [Clostridia bacterium]